MCRPTYPTCATSLTAVTNFEKTIKQGRKPVIYFSKFVKTQNKFDLNKSKKYF